MMGTNCRHLKERCGFFLKRFSDLPSLNPVYLPYASETCFITPFVEETIFPQGLLMVPVFKHHLTVAVCASFQVLYSIPLVDAPVFVPFYGGFVTVAL